MSKDSATATPDTEGFSVEYWAAFWANPSMDVVGDILAPDITGDWPGREPVVGREDYVAAIGDVLAAVPDIRLEVIESARNGDVIFIQWLAHGTGADGPFQLSGIDRIRVRDGVVVDNVIRFDSAAFLAAVGGASQEG